MKAHVRPYYYYKRYFLSLWKIMNENGELVYSGRKESCKEWCNLLNNLYDLGYAMGKNDMLDEIKRELNK